MGLLAYWLEVNVLKIIAIFVIAALFFIFPLIILSAIEQVTDINNEWDDESEDFKRRNGE